MTEAVCCCDGNGWVPCWQCHGEGGFHDCGEDCCPCLDKEELTELCDECEGLGGFRCPLHALSAWDLEDEP